MKGGSPGGNGIIFNGEKGRLTANKAATIGLGHLSLTSPGTSKTTASDLNLSPSKMDGLGQELYGPEPGSMGDGLLLTISGLLSKLCNRHEKPGI
eukprot:scaffold540571_cov42-Prasinocladus_malaysianus.AAC.1